MKVKDIKIGLRKKLIGEYVWTDVFEDCSMDRYKVISFSRMFVELGYIGENEDLDNFETDEIFITFNDAKEFVISKSFPESERNLFLKFEEEA